MIQPRIARIPRIFWETCINRHPRRSVSDVIHPPRRTPYNFANLESEEALLLIRHHSLSRFLQFQLSAHLLNLGGLLFYRCYQTGHSAFQFCDPLLLLSEFTDFHLRLGALGNACSQLRSTAIDERCAQVTIGVDVYGEGGASINGRAVDATDKRGCEVDSAGSNPSDGNHILVASKTGIGNVNIVADDIWIGTRVSA
jgi:hypothetical protein